MIRMIALTAAALVAGWFALSVVSGIDTGDVVAYHKLQKHIGSDAVRAGDVVAFAPGTTDPRLLCSMDVDQGVLREASVNKMYVNGMAAALPQFTALVDWTLSHFGKSDPAAEIVSPPAALVFFGRVSRFPEDGAMPPMSRDCACAVARSQSSFEQVCVVERSLIETQMLTAGNGAPPVPHDTTVGVTVRNGNFFFPDVAALGCAGILDAPTTAIAREPAPCGQGMERSFDVALRDTLGVIREQPVEDQD